MQGSRRNSAGLARDIEVLEVLGRPEAVQSGGLGVVRIATLVGRDKTVVSRTLATLGESGLVDRDPDTQAYRLGSRLYALAARTAEGALAWNARGHLKHLAQVTRETAHLCVLRGGNVLTLLSELSPNRFHTTGWEGVTTAAWRTPSGRALLSDWDAGSLGVWYAEHGHDEGVLEAGERADSTFAVLEKPSPRPNSITDLDTLVAELRRVRERGYATSDEELERGVVAASAPVYDFTSRVVAALNVSAPKERIGAQLDKLGRIVSGAARDLSAALGYPG
ncbi:transcriptional regulator, IclR family [Lentzea albidocapillata subsp. violacea]|uniref:Transcriptional regulator, IclR family n=1 Tax=Lentzea albidocapillata subsp. violacea TaxID=128104 RepID=A0A1G8PKY5_9PSEU|nr:IclR family transcriptional regulator [Lentzea albidocapillata]SDI93042.1 transcriptional regulator, IclR family [Lentzea albidocapillata subsp. violacea]